MTRTLDEVIASLPGDERAKIEARAKELIAIHMTIEGIRDLVGWGETIALEWGGAPPEVFQFFAKILERVGP